MDLRDRFLGSMLGLALGDALGAPFEGASQVDAGAWESFLRNPPHVLRYTDDTEMAMGVAESLAEKRAFDAGDMAARFVRNFTPWRGYGQGTVRVLELIRKGTPWDEANRVVFPQGSFGNGAAMRSAPIGLFYHDERESLATVTRQASAITHAHRLAQEGALIVTRTVASILAGKTCEDIATELPEMSGMPEYREKLRAVLDFLQEESPVGSVVSLLGNSVLAVEAVPAALYCFLRFGSHYRDTVGYSVSLGGDTDTIAAMAGAMAGALVGTEGIPQALLKRLESRERMESLALALFEAFAGK
jgi:poly(ADP-ribose) glycohydrolase ARH3